MRQKLSTLIYSFVSLAYLNSRNIRYLDSFLAECIKTLPIRHSMLAFQIIVKCLKNHFKQEHINLKHLHLELNYSELAVRKQIIRLQKLGWIELRFSEEDKRVKYVYASEKLINQCNQILFKTAP
jgi:DNA-binding MarR family transcriptional regulator